MQLMNMLQSPFLYEPQRCWEHQGPTHWLLGSAEIQTSSFSEVDFVKLLDGSSWANMQTPDHLPATEPSFILQSSPGHSPEVLPCFTSSMRKAFSACQPHLCEAEPPFGGVCASPSVQLQFLGPSLISWRERRVIRGGGVMKISDFPKYLQVIKPNF